MAWFDEPGKYYRTGFDLSTPISQGDIVIAPSVTVAPGTADTDVAAPLELDSSRSVTLWHSGSDELPAAPSMNATVRWGLAMVLPHPCAMEKEWNERVAELEARGIPEAAAISAATADSSLDRYLAIAPILAYDNMPPRKATTIAQGNRLGAFPVCPDAGVPAAYVDLNRISTVEYTAARPGMRIKALSDLAAAHLQHALALFFAFRAQSKLGDVEAAVGEKIVTVTCTRNANRLNVGMILGNGSTLTLTGDRRPDVPAGPERAARQ